MKLHGICDFLYRDPRHQLIAAAVRPRLFVVAQAPTALRAKSSSWAETTTHIKSALGFPGAAAALADDFLPVVASALALQAVFLVLPFPKRIGLSKGFPSPHQSIVDGFHVVVVGVGQTRGSRDPELARLP